MSPLFFNLLLAIVGVFVVVGLTSIPALVQLPVPVSQAARRRQSRPVFRFSMAGAY